MTVSLCLILRFEQPDRSQSVLCKLRVLVETKLVLQPENSSSTIWGPFIWSLKCFWDTYTSKRLLYCGDTACDTEVVTLPMILRLKRKIFKPNAYRRWIIYEYYTASVTFIFRKAFVKGTLIEGSFFLNNLIILEIFSIAETCWSSDSLSCIMSKWSLGEIKMHLAELIFGQQFSS